MEDILTILAALAVLAMVAVIMVYNHFDRYSFRIERLLRHYREPLDDWARECAQLLPGCGDGYFSARNPRARVECLRQMADAVRAGSGRLPEPSEHVSDFLSSYNMLAESYDRQLGSVLLGPVGRLTGQKPWGRLELC